MLKCNLCNQIIDDTIPELAERVYNHLENEHEKELKEYDSKYPEVGTDETIQDFFECMNDYLNGTMSV